MKDPSQRIRRRIACELVVGARIHKGFVRDLSPSGAFVVMDAAALRSDSVQAELRLSESTFCAPLTLQCEIARRDLTPAMLARSADRGVDLRILEAPIGYHEAYLAATAANAPPVPIDDGMHDVEIEVATGENMDVAQVEPSTEPATALDAAGFAAGFPAGFAADLDADLPASLAAVLTADLDDDEFAVASRAEDLPGLRSATGVTPKRASRRQVQPVESTPAAVAGPSASELRSRQESARGIQATLDAMRAAVLGTGEQIDAMLVYDGHELDDLYALLEDIGVKPLRARLTGPTRYDGWVHPPRVFVIPARAALETRLPEGVSAQNVCRIAVTDSTSGVLGSIVSKLGYNYLIRRPVHPEVIRMLFERALYRGKEARRSQRRPAARRVVLKVGWRRIPATLVDISEGGARLLVRSEVKLLESISLGLPASTTGGRRLRLVGRVIRKRRNAADGVRAIAMRFADPIEKPILVEIARKLSQLALGPAPEPPTPWLDRFREWREARALRRARAALAGPVEEVAAPEAPPERRRMGRSKLDTEVVRLDPETAAMCAVLVGRDISVGGMRIDPHPDTAVGDCLSLAVHDPAHGPLLLNARVTRDDGPRGMVLEFDGLTQASAAALERLVGALPAAPVGQRPRVDPDAEEASAPGIEALGEDGSEGIVLARILTAQASPLDVHR